jgi:hypothetical protein
VRRNPQHISLSTAVPATSATGWASSATSSTQLWAALCDKYFPSLRGNISFAHKAYNRTLIFCSVLLKHGRHFDYWNQPLNMLVRVCYLDCHEAGLCCHLVIQTENLLLPLQVFYFHLCPIYWLSLVFSHFRLTLFKYCPIFFICVLFAQFIVFLFTNSSSMLRNFYLITLFSIFFYSEHLSSFPLRHSYLNIKGSYLWLVLFWALLLSVLIILITQILYFSFPWNYITS